MEKRFKGCLFGLAIGDALGAPVEFLSWQQIKKKYGDSGIKDFDSWGGFAAGTYTDDTQMSLATAAGCVEAWVRGREKGIWHPPSVVYSKYLEWYKTQSDPKQTRGPGHTCLSALRSGRMGSVDEPINNSKGCGGVMRTAPAGLAFPPGQAFEQGVAFAAITHGHPSGYLPAGVLAEITAHLVRGRALGEAIGLSLIPLRKYRGYAETMICLEKAMDLAKSNLPVTEAIERIGEGWVGEEALAISVYCSLKFSHNWARGTLAAVNHSGDSDSTGSITGAILGTLLGLEAIPTFWVIRVENTGYIERLATEMWELFAKK